MFSEIIELTHSAYSKGIRLMGLIVLGVLMIATPFVSAQTSSSSDADANDYKVTSSIEFGVRGLDVDGNENKYRSDLNYKRGFRVFDSSVLIENKSGRDKFFDTFVMNTSGFGADPAGAARFSLEKTGMYRFDGNVRRVKYFNNLANIARNQHTRNSDHYFGDFDFTAFPIGDKLQVTVGASFDRNQGPGSWTIRGFRANASDEWGVDSQNDSRANDLRAGVSGELAGFNLSLSHGYRRFKDNTNFSINAFNPGLNPTNTSIITGFSRIMPVKGTSNYTMFNAHRTFAKRVDFTGRLIYSTVDTLSQMTERITGRDSSNNFVDLDSYDISGNAKRIQKRGDFGLTIMATNKFRISNTFTIDAFGIDGGNELFAATVRRSPTGVPQVVAPQRTTSYRVTDFQRYLNTLEADYQFNKNVGLHVGYRYSHRRIELQTIDATLTSPSSPTNPLIDEDTEKNHTHTWFGGMKIMPMNNWVIFWDAEHGDADNVFTRLSNYKFTNLRVRSRWNYKKFALNLSGITKDNENPSISTAPPSAPTYPAGELVANTKTRIFAGSADWSPMPELTLGAGYTYQQLTSETNIVINVGTLQLGNSSYYMRDHHAFVNISANPVKRVSIYGSYSFNQDRGQGSRLSTAPQFIISSYPFKMQSPEARVAFRITRNIDWNIGYQYYRYNEDILNTMPLRYPPFTVQPPPLLITDTPASQNYRAHLPYTSLRIYFGGGDR